MIIYHLTFFAIFLAIVNGACRQSYMTFCDNLEDIKNEKVEKWKSLVIGDEKSENPDLKPVDFDALSLYRFEKLTTLIIVKQVNDIKTYTFELDREDTKVDHLQFYGNDIKRIRFTTFSAMLLRNLLLNNNNIAYIHKGAFYNCEITTIDLSNNKLEIIEAGVFDDEYLIRNKTKEIILRNNRIEAIGPMSFPSSLEILNLDNNNIDFLGPAAFANLVNLQELSLSNNKMKSLLDINYLINIVTVDASYNNIVIFTASKLNNLTRLAVLDVSHNQIATPSIFENFNFPKRSPSLQISLAYNHLTHLILRNDSFRDHIVFLYGNPWNCKCWSKLEKFMADNNVKRNKCDLQFFGNGETPYCINYPQHCPNCEERNGKKCNFTDVNIGDFLQKLQTVQMRIECSLVPKPL